MALQPQEVLRRNPTKQIVQIGSNQGIANTATSVLLTTTRPRKDQVEAVPLPETEKRVKAKEKKRGGNELVPLAPGDRIAEVAHREGEDEIVLLADAIVLPAIVGTLLPPTGNL